MRRNCGGKLNGFCRLAEVCDFFFFLPLFLCAFFSPRDSREILRIFCVQHLNMQFNTQQQPRVSWFSCSKSDRLSFESSPVFSVNIARFLVSKHTRAQGLAFVPSRMDQSALKLICKFSICQLHISHSRSSSSHPQIPTFFHFQLALV